MPLSLSHAASAGADDISDPEQKFVQIEVWDHKLVKQFRGRVDVPLKQVLDNQRVKDSYRSALLSDPFLCKTVRRKFCLLNSFGR